MEEKLNELYQENLEAFVYDMLAAKARNENIHRDFKGHTFYSMSITMDKAFQEVYGCTKDEYDINNNVVILDTQSNDNIESIIYTLLATKAIGIHASCYYKGKQINSDRLNVNYKYMENSESLEIKQNDNFESIINKLIEAKNNNEKKYCCFNGHVLFSNDVSIDEAYMEVFNCDKEEYQKKYKRVRY